MKTSEVCHNRELCSGCSACVNVCSHEAISMKPDWRGFLYPTIDSLKCVDCGLCEKRCPANNGKKTFTFPQSIAFVEKNTDYLLSASSGGAFGVMARYVLSKGGIVYGVTMDDNYNVYFTGIRDLTELPKLHGSKYVQPYVGDVYSDVRTELKKNTAVLFCGLPCHVAGLKSYLNHDYENLITMDLICHGVPSQSYFKDYVQDKLRRNANIDSFKFRYKGENNHVHVGYKNRDYYMTYFLWGKGCRNSCYHCLYAGGERPADFTIGDYWNNAKNNVLSDVQNGASLVLFNSTKALSYKFLYEENGECKEINSLEDAISADGGNLGHPSYSDFRTKLIYVLYKMFGVSGPKFLFRMDCLRMGIK